MLNWLGRAGYTEIEMAGDYGFTARQVRGWADDAGLLAVSGHDGLNLDVPDGQWEAAYRATLEGAKTMGQQFTGVLAWHPGPHTVERYKFLADRFDKAAVMATSVGLQFFYHNHDFEFSNKRPTARRSTTLLEETDANRLMFELDLYWIVVGGESPLDYLARDPSRWPLYHVKDKIWDATAPAERPGGRRPRLIDFPDIFAAGRAPRGQALLHRARRAAALAPWLTRRRSTRPRRQARLSARRAVVGDTPHGGRGRGGRPRPPRALAERRGHSLELVEQDGVREVGLRRGRCGREQLRLRLGGRGQAVARHRAGDHRGGDRRGERGPVPARPSRRRRSSDRCGLIVEPCATFVFARVNVDCRFDPRAVASTHGPWLL